MKHKMKYYANGKRGQATFETAEEALIFGLLLGDKVTKIYESHTFMTWHYINLGIGRRRKQS